MKVHEYRNAGAKGANQLLKKAVVGSEREVNDNLIVLEEIAIHILANHAKNRADSRSFSEPVSQTKSIMYFKDRIEETVEEMEKSGEETYIKIGEKNESSTTDRKSN